MVAETNVVGTAPGWAVYGPVEERCLAGCTADKTKGIESNLT